MNIKGALKLAQKRWGKKALVRDSKTPSSPELREAARIKYDLLRMGPVEPGTDRIARKKRLDELSWPRHYYRYCVGDLMELLGAFHIHGQGDTWEEAFAEADKRDNRKQA